MTKFAILCYEHHKYQQCIKWCNEIINITENKWTKAAKLLKGKACFYSYQRHIWNIIALQSRGTLSHKSKMVDSFKKMAKETISLLSNALDNSYIDEEGKQILDLAMMDYVRELNRLQDFKRCILCLKKTAQNLKASHIVPKSVLERLILDDMGFVLDDKRAFLVFRRSNCNPMQMVQSAGEITYKLLCQSCEQLLSNNGEQQFASLFSELYSEGCRYGELFLHPTFLPVTDIEKLCRVIEPSPISYGPWLFNFCVGMIFRAMCFLHMPQFSNDKEVYQIFCRCRAHLLGLNDSQTRDSTPWRKSDNGELYIIPSSVAKHSSALRGAFISATNMRLDDGTPDVCNKINLILIHLGNVSILLKLQPAKNVNVPAYLRVSPNEGEFQLPPFHELIPLPKGIIASFLQIKQMQVDCFPESEISLNKVTVQSNHLPALLAITKNTRPNERTELCTKLVHAEHGTFQCLHLPVVCFHVPSFNVGKAGVLYQVHLLPREYKIDRLGTQRSIKRVQLPQGHKVLLHISEKVQTFSETYLIVADVNELHKNNYTAGIYALCVRFQGRNSEFAFGVYLLVTECGHLEVKSFMHKKADELLQLSAIQDALDYLTLDLYTSKIQCRNFKTYIQRIKYSRLVCMM